ncbi:MAG: hypothetical protein ABSC51_07415 [Gaiellaceae bacterium]|jgi:uncharacterized Zn finger protein
MPRENAEIKGRRLLVEGRLAIRRADSGGIVADCRGDSGAVYRVTYDARVREWRCTCPALSRCSHLHALMLVVALDERRT